MHTEAGRGARSACTARPSRGPSAERARAARSVPVGVDSQGHRRHFVAAIEQNGSGIPDSLESGLAEAVTAERSENSVNAWWADGVTLLAMRN